MNAKNGQRPYVSVAELIERATREVREQASQDDEREDAELARLLDASEERGERGERRLVNALVRARALARDSEEAVISAGVDSPDRAGALSADEASRGLAGLFGSAPVPQRRPRQDTRAETSQSDAPTFQPVPRQPAQPLAPARPAERLATPARPLAPGQPLAPARPAPAQLTRPPLARTDPVEKPPDERQREAELASAQLVLEAALADLTESIDASDAAAPVQQPVFQTSGQTVGVEPEPEPARAIDSRLVETSAIGYPAARQAERPGDPVAWADALQTDDLEPGDSHTVEIELHDGLLLSVEDEDAEEDEFDEPPTALFAREALDDAAVVQEPVYDSLASVQEAAHEMDDEEYATSFARGRSANRPAGGRAIDDLVDNLSRELDVDALDADSLLASEFDTLARPPSPGPAGVSGFAGGRPAPAGARMGEPTGRPDSVLEALAGLRWDRVPAGHPRAASPASAAPAVGPGRAVDAALDELEFESESFDETEFDDGDVESIEIDHLIAEVDVGDAEVSQRAPDRAESPMPPPLPWPVEPAVPRPPARTLRKAGTPERPFDQTLRKAGTPERPFDQTLRKAGTPERPFDQTLRKAGTPERPFDQTLRKAGTPERPSEGTPRRPGQFTPSAGRPVVADNSAVPEPIPSEHSDDQNAGQGKKRGFFRRIFNKPSS